MGEMEWGGGLEWVREREEHCLGLSIVWYGNKKNWVGACEKVTLYLLLFVCEKAQSAVVTFVVVRTY
jgi:hypothetical protein